MKNYIGAGYYGTVVPPVILRNVLENPAWYTAYTPYQPEISQGRLESLLNYQTMITDMTGLPFANASLLDESTAAAEAMTLTLTVSKRRKTRFFISEDCHPQTIAVCKTRADGLGIQVEVGDAAAADFSGKDFCGALLQYPATDGSITDYGAFVEKVHEGGALVVVATDLMALTMLKSPGEFGADVAVGNSQRFGVPMGYGGPHAAFFATTDKYKRLVPGRVIGVSRDNMGKTALRMAMQTREQHIRRDKATSNICTAQALLANTAAFYALYHGPDGLRKIADKIHGQACVLSKGLESLGYSVDSNCAFFDTVKIDTPHAKAICDAAVTAGYNFRQLDEGTVSVALDETTELSDVNTVLEVFAMCNGATLSQSVEQLAAGVTGGVVGGGAADQTAHERVTPYLTHSNFHLYRTETEMLRYIHHLAGKDLGLQTAMIPLGSCTMKLNATSEMIPVTWPEFGNMHPFAPLDQVEGYSELTASLIDDLAEITGFHTVCLQPNSGATGEYAGLLTIREYHRSRGDHHRNVCIIPVSAHGTNPASAAMCGMNIVVVKSDEQGNIDPVDFKAKVEENSENLAALMVTYPSTYGVFEEGIKEICATIHEHGGQVYMDGANMNAQVGICRPGDIGADVCHLNLHKTFCIPHGGGGPGVGPIGLAKQLAPFAPGHVLVPECAPADTQTGAVAGAPWGSASILPISWMYNKMMGGDGLKEATEAAILSANYMATRLDGPYEVLYTGTNGRCAHEFILDVRGFKASCGIEATHIAKRLQDYSFHAPTMSWPVTNTLMIEPTESESKVELDRFVDALLAIREEIRGVEQGLLDAESNVLTNAPHSMEVIANDDWEFPYSRNSAAYPMPILRERKFWPSVGKLDDVYGDRNVVCTCPPLESWVR